MAAAKKTAKKTPTSKSKPKGKAEPVTKLQLLLVKAFPKHRTSTYYGLDIVWLAGKLGVTDEGAYVWLRANSLPMKRARQIVKIEGCRITLDDLLPFVS